ncbi:MAG: C40 family peptidase [Bacteroidota bacterium]
MKFGICNISIIPLRKEARHQSEMISQLLFGELYVILSEENEWTFVRTCLDNYEGWISKPQSYSITEESFHKLNNYDTSLTADLVQLITNETRKQEIIVTLGCSLPNLINNTFYIEDEKYTYHGAVMNRTPKGSDKVRKEIIENAYVFLNAPYLWGGRTPFGVDCSGFIQMIYHLSGVTLQRDAAKQAEQGDLVHWVSEAIPGDLAFFDNQEGDITHVGMLLSNSRVIHASGKVRIDAIDHLGIFNEEVRRYSHKIRLIKRML